MSDNAAGSPSTARDRAIETSPEHRARVRAHERAVEVIADRLDPSVQRDIGNYETARAVLAILFAHPEVLRALAGEAEPDEMEEHFLDANERMGEALTKIGMTAGLPRPTAQHHWGADQIVRRVEQLREDIAMYERWAELSPVRVVECSCGLRHSVRIADHEIQEAVPAGGSAPADTGAAALVAFADDIEQRMPLLREPDPLSDWSRGVAWTVDRARATAANSPPTDDLRPTREMDDDAADRVISWSLFGTTDTDLVPDDSDLPVGELRRLVREVAVPSLRSHGLLRAGGSAPHQGATTDATALLAHLDWLDERAMKGGHLLLRTDDVRALLAGKSIPIGPSADRALLGAGETTPTTPETNGHA